MSRRAFDTATDALEARLALDAATETADAFNDAYERETTRSTSSTRGRVTSTHCR